MSVDSEVNEPSNRKLSEDIVIGIVLRDRFSMFRQCLKALYKHTDVPFRVIAVVGNADKTTREYLNQLQLKKDNFKAVFVNHLLMQGEGRNIALKEVKERFCVVLENDTIVHENWLSPLIECMQEENSAVVAPLIFWYRGIHAAGCMFANKKLGNQTIFDHKILYTGIYRKRIDYPENHCILIDRKQFPSNDIFDDVEPFDVDLGLLLRKHGLTAFLEPRSVVTYSAPPPLEISDIPSFKFRWDPISWEKRNRVFMEKWRVRYDPLSKIASYRRQQLKLGIAYWRPNKFTVGISNSFISLLNNLQS